MLCFPTHFQNLSSRSFHEFGYSAASALSGSGAARPLTWNVVLMAAESAQKPARFTTFADLLASSDPSQLGLQRIIGRLDKYDSRLGLIWLRDCHAPSLQLAVDSSHLDPSPPAVGPGKVGVLYQFIGEVDYRDIPVTDEATGDHTPSRCPVMKALLYRCMDGLDMDLYLRAHEARMKDLEQPIDASPHSQGTCGVSEKED